MNDLLVIVNVNKVYATNEITEEESQMTAKVLLITLFKLIGDHRV